MNKRPKLARLFFRFHYPEFNTMQKIVSALLFVLCALPVFTPAYAQRTPEPIVDYLAVAYAPSGGKLLGESEIRAAIKKAAASLQWDIADGPTPQQLVGTLMVRQKHTIQVSIKIDPKSYALIYRNSINMNYAANGMSPNDKLFIGFRPPSYFEGKEAPVIHPSYNKWVKNLVNAINWEIRQL